MPPMTPDGERRATRVPTSNNSGPFDSPEDFSLYDRCITRGVLGGILPVPYNNGNQIVQGPGFVAFRYEMVHETRIIPLNGGPHISQNIRSFMGDARGHWEGTTLVVETTNFNGRTGITGNGRNTPYTRDARITERFTRVAEDTLNYEVTIDDPKTWTRPWKIAFPLMHDPSYQIFEYACHEGNNAMHNMLSGARADDRAAGR